MIDFTSSIREEGISTFPAIVSSSCTGRPRKANFRRSLGKLQIKYRLGNRKSTLNCFGKPLVEVSGKWSL